MKRRRLARSICAACPVRTECLEFALDCEKDQKSGSYGMFGGLLAAERDAVRGKPREDQLAELQRTWERVAPESEEGAA